MGILDQKTRFVDSIVTQAGRAQIASGHLRAEFYSFSDAGAIYALTDTFSSGSGIGADLATKFCFEANNLPQDQVTFKADDSGQLVVREFRSVGDQTVRVLNGQLFSGSMGGSMQRLTSSAEFTDMAVGLLSSSIDNFNNLYILGSPDLLDVSHDEFILEPEAITFDITDDRPLPPQTDGGVQEANVDNIESLFADKRLSHVPNFKYLPPVNKPRIGSQTHEIGIFPQIAQQPLLEYADVQQELDALRSQGYVRDISFTETSIDSRVMGQFFELSNGQVTKLDVIDFGTFDMSDSQLTEEEVAEAESKGHTLHTKRVFFVGKVYVDSNGSHTFVNMFELVLS